MYVFYLLFLESGLWGSMVSPSQLQLVLQGCHLPGASREAQEELLPLWTTPVAQLLQWNFTKAGDPDQVLMTAVGKGGKALQHGQLKLSNWLENAQGLVSTAFPSPASNGDSEAVIAAAIAMAAAAQWQRKKGHLQATCLLCGKIHQYTPNSCTRMVSDNRGIQFLLNHH